MNGNWLWDRKISDAKAKRALLDPGSSDFITLAALLLSRKNDPKEVFNKYIDPLVFCKQWTSIKRRMRRDKWSSPRIIFWQAIYENLAEKYRAKGVVFRKNLPQLRKPICQLTGKRISDMRRQQGLSQKELAKKIGISQQLISRIEKGSENMSLITLTTIARALDKRVEIDLISR